MFVKENPDRKKRYQKYLSYQTAWKEYCAEKKIYDSPAAEEFLNSFTEVFSQGVLSISRCSVFAKSAVAHVLRMKYQQNP